MDYVTPKDKANEWGIVKMLIALPKEIPKASEPFIFQNGFRIDMILNPSNSMGLKF